MKWSVTPTPRIDAVERVTGRATYTNDMQLPGMLYAQRAAQPASARAHPVDRRVQGEGAARREGDPHARELPGGLGRRSDRRRPAVQRRGQEDHQAAPLRVQQPGPVRGRAGGGGRCREPARGRRGAAHDRRRLRSRCRSCSSRKRRSSADAP